MAVPKPEMKKVRQAVVVCAFGVGCEMSDMTGPFGGLRGEGETLKDSELGEAVAGGQVRVAGQVVQGAGVGVQPDGEQGSPLLVHGLARVGPHAHGGLSTGRSAERL